MKKDPFSQLSSLNGPVLITGNTGFKGAWLTYLLMELGIPTVGLSKPAEHDSLYARSEMHGLIPEYLGDIRDRSFVQKVFEETSPAVVIHMAAQPLVLNSYLAPHETFETNVLGTLNVIDAAFQTDSVKVIGAITTDKVYRNDNSLLRFSEQDPLEGKDPYSASKVGTESVVAAWQHISSLQSGPKIVALRAGNVIGGGDFAENRLIPDIVRAKSKNKPLKVRNLESSRPWQHVLDPLWGYLLAVEKILGGEPIKALNFGPEEESLKVREVLQIVSRKWPIEVLNEPAKDTIEASSLELDSSAARKLLNWQPKFSQEEAILETLAWWDEVEKGKFSAKEQCEIQVRQYLSS
jgi:CDP-glucose 4,6-dehydratase